MAATAHRLNLMAALFLPLTAVASVLGMEVKSGLADTRENFYYIVGGGIALGLIVALLLRRKG
jgi:Mg2+ and Co2+ transporter CorA